jgi:uncharacterized protein (TIGR03435 family)
MLVVAFILGLTVIPKAATIAPVEFSQVPEFEVASIHENKTGDGWKLRFTSAGMIAMNVSLEELVREAYGVYDEKLLSGGPKWLSSKTFDIEAKFDTSRFKNPTADQQRRMLQKLLQERFRLVIHHQSKSFPVYALVVVKNGSQSKESGNGSMVEDSTYGQMCQILRSGSGINQSKECTMADLAFQLSFLPEVGRTVVDQTGLNGRYDFELHWAPVSANESIASASPFPQIFTALQEQLGLQLKPTNAPLDTIVIDQVEMPSEN